MFGLIKDVNWLVILDRTKIGGEFARSSLIRKVNVHPMPLDHFTSFDVELDGEGTYKFMCELRHDISDESVAYWIEDYSRKKLYEEVDGVRSMIGYGEYEDTYAFFTGRTKKSNFILRDRFLRNLLENQNYEDKSGSLAWRRVFAAGSPFATK